jgi:hypothetical protein
MFLPVSFIRFCTTLKEVVSIVLKHCALIGSSKELKSCKIRRQWRKMLSKQDIKNDENILFYVRGLHTMENQ